jgi:hypothetical protein
MPINYGDSDMTLAFQAVCLLIANLPPELRNQIYEYVFTTDKSTHRNLVTAKAEQPWSNVLFTCKCIFAEARGIFNVPGTPAALESLVSSNHRAIV